jgi:CxxC-x17-CxxC domain-containing protein
MDFVDRELKCIECGATFVFTAGEQVFFREMKFEHDPRQCKRCRATRNRSARKPVRFESRVICAECGSETTVPFAPRYGRPVLCRECFQKRMAAG